MSFVDRSGPGGIVHNPASSYAKEMAKWEMDYSPYGPPGRPRAQVGHQDYPCMFYKMVRSKTNGDFLCEDTQQAQSDADARSLESRGYRTGQLEAIAYVEGLEQTVAVAAAERNYRDKGMSEKAKAEAQVADDATVQHLAEVPVTPIKKRVRRTKAQMAAAGK